MVTNEKPRPVYSLSVCMSVCEERKTEPSGDKLRTFGIKEGTLGGESEMLTVEEVLQ